MSLKRDKEGGIIGGVCKGIESSTGVDAWMWRFIFLVSGVPAIYLLMWVFIEDKNYIDEKDK
tara:strand:+ start:1086 stop:1271 length:186 start_codon:yes stop_codon:yes gene_type:complete